jgi:signal transduction histidine kinase
MVSHETRSALVGIQGLSELIRDGDLPPDEMRSYAADIFSEAQKINALIGQMFDLNRLETGQTTFREVRVDMNAIGNDVVIHTPRDATEPTIELDLRADPSVVAGDPDRLRQAVLNVVGFCARTARTGSRIVVATSFEKSLVHMTIQSSSLKLVEFDDWLYGRYERYEERPSAVMGAGLGLAVARTIIELHGGRIGVNNTSQGGTEFQISLPAA